MNGRWPAGKAILTCGMTFAISSSFAASPLPEAAMKKWCGSPIIGGDELVGNGTRVVLTGILTTRREWGPPNFGENPKTDSRWTAWILKLDFITPVRLSDYDVSPPRRKTTPLRELQVRGILEKTPDRYKRLLNHHVAVTGKVWQASIAADVTDTEMDTEQIHLTNATVCDGRNIR